MEKEAEWINLKKLEEIDSEQEQCRDLQKQLAQMEEEFRDQNKCIKAVNDELFERYPQDKELQELLVQKEEDLRQKGILEERMLEDCREEINRRMQELEREKDDISEELRKGERRDENYDID